MSRSYATANLTRYVSSTGNDGDSGLSSTSKWLTPQRAWDETRYWDFAGYYEYEVYVADGTYGPLFVSGEVVGAGSPHAVKFIGNAASPNLCRITSTAGAAVTIYDEAGIALTGFEYSAQGSSKASAGILVNNGRLGLYGSGYAACDWAQIHAVGPRSVLNMDGNPVVYGNAAYHVLAEDGARVYARDRFYNFIGSVTFTEFANVNQGSLFDVTNTGWNCISSTGVIAKRFNLTSGGTLRTNSASTDSIPGNVAGVINGGYFVS